jgi:hypothetical protein
MADRAIMDDIFVEKKRQTNKNVELKGDSLILRRRPWPPILQMNFVGPDRFLNGT